MGLLPNLIYYASVATTEKQIVAQYVDGDAELPAIAARCLDQLPPFHSRFSYTTQRRTLGCIIEESFIYCAIVDKALDKAKTFLFLEQVRDEFKMHLRTRGLPLDGIRFESHSLDDDFAPIVRRLVIPFCGIPQKEKDRLEEELQAQRKAEAEFEETSRSAAAHLYEYDDQALNLEACTGSRSPSAPLIGKSNKHKQKRAKDQANGSKDNKMESKGKSTDKVQRLEVMIEGSSQPSTGTHMQKAGSMRNRSQQMARRMWWKNVKVVLLLDGIVCLILFAIWLGICRGFSCIQKSATGS